MEPVNNKTKSPAQRPDENSTTIQSHQSYIDSSFIQHKCRQAIP